MISTSKDTVRMIGHPLDIDPDPTHAALLKQMAEGLAGHEPHSWRDGPEHVIAGERQSGKTRLALRWLLDSKSERPRILITSSERLAAQLREQAGLSRKDRHIISWRTATKSPLDPEAEYGIDEAIDILATFLRLPKMPSLVTVCTAAPWQG